MSSASSPPRSFPESIPPRKPGIEPYYPINDEKNNELFAKYRELADQEKNVIFGGRLGNYKYYDMDKVIAAALETVKEELD